MLIVTVFFCSFVINKCEDAFNPTQRTFKLSLSIHFEQAFFALHLYENI